MSFIFNIIVIQLLYFLKFKPWTRTTTNIQSRLSDGQRKELSICKRVNINKSTHNKRSNRFQTLKIKLSGFGWSTLSSIDPNPDNFCGAGIIHTTTQQYGCLYRLEPNKQAQVCLNFQLITNHNSILYCIFHFSDVSTYYPSEQRDDFETYSRATRK